MKTNKIIIVIGTSLATVQQLKDSLVDDYSCKVVSSPKRVLNWPYGLVWRVKLRPSDDGDLALDGTSIIKMLQYQSDKNGALIIKEISSSHE